GQNRERETGSRIELPLTCQDAVVVEGFLEFGQLLFSRTNLLGVVSSVLSPPRRKELKRSVIYRRTWSWGRHRRWLRCRGLLHYEMGFSIQSYQAGILRETSPTVRTSYFGSRTGTSR